ncbi:MAG: hypothetical protein PF442_03950 [Desulfobulbaceae bacterium]|jgi:hypothetical protein|nr:hypothetical protein [Desulfobulbaceae bacterium]
MSIAFSPKGPCGFNKKGDMGEYFFLNKKKKHNTKFNVYLWEIAPVVVLACLHNLFDIYCITGLLTEPSPDCYLFRHLAYVDTVCINADGFIPFGSGVLREVVSLHVPI